MTQPNNSTGERKVRCKNCEYGHVLIGVNYVSHEMALDAGEPAMEGMEEPEWGQCPCCHGNWQDCKNCREEENEGD